MFDWKTKTQHWLQPVSGEENDLLKIVSNFYFKSKPTIRQLLMGWLR